MPEEHKRATKQIVDVVFDKLGALLGGAVILTAVRFLHRPEAALLLAAGGLAVVALSLTRSLHRGYVATLEAGLRAGSVRLDPEDVVDSTTRLSMSHVHVAAGVHRAAGATPVPGLGESLRQTDPLLGQIADLLSGHPDRIRRVLGDPGPLNAALVAHIIPLVGREEVHLEALRALRRLAAQATGQILDGVLDVETDPAVRRRLARALKAAPSQRGVDGLLLGLRDPDFQVRASCAGSLAAMLARVPELTVSAEAVFAAVGRELSGSLPGGEDVALDEGAVVSQVFALLSLVLDREPVRIAARAVRGSDPILRGTALEYLENVLPTEVRRALLRRLAAPREQPSRPLEEVMTDLLRSSGAHAAGRDRRLRRALKPRG